MAENKKKKARRIALKKTRVASRFENDDSSIDLDENVSEKPIKKRAYKRRNKLDEQEI